MGASDWARQMCVTLEDQFEVSGDRAARITNLVRRFAAAPRYDAVLGVNEQGPPHPSSMTLVHNLNSSLQEQPGESIEERWNNLMDELNCQARTEYGVYLVPWDEYDPDDRQNMGVSRDRPE